MPPRYRRHTAQQNGGQARPPRAHPFRLGARRRRSLCDRSMAVGVRHHRQRHSWQCSRVIASNDARSSFSEPLVGHLHLSTNSGHSRASKCQFYGVQQFQEHPIQVVKIEQLTDYFPLIAYVLTPGAQRFHCSGYVESIVFEQQFVPLPFLFRAMPS